MGRCHQDNRRTRLCCKPVDGLQLDDPHAEGPDDPPSPTAVPSPIATAQDPMTQVGTSAVGIAPADTNANVMIPMAFRHHSPHG